MIRSHSSQWAKLCIEQCADEGVSIVSVVTDPWSDDNNNECLESSHSYLRITRKGNIIAFHYSLDGQHWRFVRKFPAEWGNSLQVGVSVQAPVIGGAEIHFEHVNLSPKTVNDFRSGE